MALPLADLSPREFEEICNALLFAEGFTTRHLGAAGGDRGWDIRAEATDGKLWCIQCKRVQSMDGSKAVRELLKVLDDPKSETPDVWCLMASRDISAKVEEDLNEAAEGRCEIQCIGKTDLQERLEAQPAVRDRFFAANAPRSRIVYLSACKADRNVAAVLRRDLQWNLRKLVGANWSVQWHDPTDSALPEVPGNTAWGVVLISPDALADAPLMRFWHDGLSTGHDTGFRRLLALSLADTVPETVGMPTWLRDRFDVLTLRLEPEAYSVDLSRIIDKWIGTTEKTLAVIDLEGPADAGPRLLLQYHGELVRWLKPLMQRKLTRHYVANIFGLDLPTSLDAFETPALQASAAVVLARGDDEPTAAALRLVVGLLAALDEEESAERLQELRGIADALRRERPADAFNRGILSSWLRKVQKDHEHLVDYFQQRQELNLLNQVYVELDMLPDAHSEARLDRRPDGGKGRDWGRPHSLEDLLELAPEDHPWVTRRWVVRGDPGAGKTTLLRHLASRLARDLQHRWVPIFQSLPVLLHSRERLLDRIERLMLEETGREGLAAVLEQEGYEGRLLILLDGLDAVGPEQREQAEGLLRSLAERWPRSPVVVSTRPIGYRRFSQTFRELQLLPLDRPRRLRFLEAWFGRADGTSDASQAETALTQLEASGLDELAGNPLYLTLMAMLLEQGQAPEKNRSKLYNQVFQLLLEGKHKHAQIQPIVRPGLVLQTLRLLAYTLTVDNRDAESRGALEDRLYRDELDGVREQLKKVPRWDGALRQFLDDLAEKVGVLGPHDGGDADWRFWHRTFKEALTAEYLASLPREELLARVAEIAGQESRWAEPFALVTGQVPSADELVRQLVDSNRTLGLLALATAQQVSDATLDDVLTLTEDPEERSKVFERIPEQLNDPDRTLKLIDRLRRRTRDGNDLFWLHHSTERIATEHEDFAEAALSLQQHFFDHIPHPDPKLFQTFDVPLKGKEKLWREIPAGTYYVTDKLEQESATPETASDLIQIELTRAFWMAAIPVTTQQYLAFDPAHRTNGKAQDLPCVDVSWFEAVSFSRWLASLPGYSGARLPTSTEWELACRAGSKTRYWSGDSKSDLEHAGWFNENAENRLHRVARKAPNAFGIYDIHGNTAEWVISSPTTEIQQLIDPTNEISDFFDFRLQERIVRGGSWRSEASLVSAAARTSWNPSISQDHLGFRIMVVFLDSTDHREEALHKVFNRAQSVEQKLETLSQLTEVYPLSQITEALIVKTIDQAQDNEVALYAISQVLNRWPKKKGRQTLLMAARSKKTSSPVKVHLIRSLAQRWQDDEIRSLLETLVRTESNSNAKLEFARTLAHHWWGESQTRQFLRDHYKGQDEDTRVGLRKIFSAEKLELVGHWEELLSQGVSQKPRPELPPGYPAIRIMSFRLRNIKTFKDTGPVNLHPKLNIFLGNNAAGKSTILRSIALAALGPAAANEVEEEAPSYLQIGKKKGIIEVAFEILAERDLTNGELGHFAVGLQVQENSKRFTPLSEIEMSLLNPSTGRTFNNSARHLDSLRDRPDLSFGLTCGYSANRTLSENRYAVQTELEKPENEWVVSLFQPEAWLVGPDALSKLMRGDTSSYEGSPLDGISSEVVAQLRGTLDHLFPNIQASAKENFDINIKGVDLNFNDLSDGYKSLLSIMGHYIKSSLQIQDWTGSPTRQHGLIIIDEIDLHLHPSWQKRAIRDLTQAFSFTQVIASSHSPLIAGSAELSSLFYLDEGNVLYLEQQLNETPSMKAWRADQILTGPGFLLDSSASDQAEAWEREAEELWSLPDSKRNEHIEARLLELELLLDKELPRPEETPQKRESMRLFEEWAMTRLKERPEKEVRQIIKEVETFLLTDE